MAAHIGRSICRLEGVSMLRIFRLGTKCMNGVAMQEAMESIGGLVRYEPDKHAAARAQSREMKALAALGVDNDAAERAAADAKAEEEARAVRNLHDPSQVDKCSIDLLQLTLFMSDFLFPGLSANSATTPAGYLRNSRQQHSLWITVEGFTGNNL